MSKDFEFQERPLEPPKIYEHDDVPAYDDTASPSQEDGVDLSKFSDDNNDVYLSDIVDDTPYVQKSPEKKPSKKQSRAVKSFGNVKNTYIFFIIVVVFSVALAVYAVFCMNDILAITKTRSSVTVTLNEEVDSSSEMINILHDYDLIQCKTFCKIFAKIRASKIGPEYPAGVYYLNGKMGLEGMLMTLQGDTTTSETVRLTFPEGLTVPEIIDKLAENEVCDRAALLSVINSTEFSYSLVAELTADEHVPYRLEGFLFPDTYEFYIGENASSVISRFLEQMEEKYPQKYRERAKELGLTDYEVITIASIIQKEAGSVSVLGKEELDSEVKEQVGVVFDGSNYPEVLSPRKLNRVLKNIFHSWDERTFLSLLKKLSLPIDKPIKQYSRGMKMKLAISAALSHNSKLLILDEATSGLDPVIRDDILDILLDFVQDEEHSILISSHITTDLEKIADYIVFIHEGKVVFSKPKDELTEQYGIVKCGAAQFDALDKSDIIVYRKMDYEWQVLISDRTAMQKKYPKAMIVPATIDEIMLLYVKGEK